MAEIKNLKPTKRTTDEIVSDTIDRLRFFKGYLAVAQKICEIDAETEAQGIAIQNALYGMLAFPQVSIDDAIAGLEGRAGQGITDG